MFKLFPESAIHSWDFTIFRYHPANRVSVWIFAGRFHEASLIGSANRSAPAVGLRVKGDEGSDGYKPIPCGMACPGSSHQKYNGFNDRSWYLFS
jgi:hypothetical protein